MYETTGNTARAYNAELSVALESYAQPRRHPSGRDRLNKLSMVGCVVVGFIAMWMLASTGASIYNYSYQNVQLQSQIQQMAATNASLTAQLDTLERPGRILNIALNQLHMQYANPIQIPVQNGR